MADRAEVAEHALFEKGANRGGKRILRTQVVRLPVPSSETHGQAGNPRADIAGAMKEALSDMQAYVYPVICRKVNITRPARERRGAGASYGRGKRARSASGARRPDPSQCARGVAHPAVLAH